MNIVDIVPCWDSEIYDTLEEVSINPISNFNLVLDMDATMVCTTGDYKTLREIFINPKYIPLRRRVYNICNEKEPGTGIYDEIFGVLRPHLFEFLVFSLQYFRNIFVWSSGEPEYVNPICEFIWDKLPIAPTDILTGDSCPSDKKGNLGKPLEILTKKYPFVTLKNTLIIDNLKQNGKSNPNNLIQIPDYEPEPTIAAFSKDETSFIDIMDFLNDPLVINCKDIRQIDKSNIFKV